MGGERVFSGQYVQRYEWTLFGCVAESIPSGQGVEYGGEGDGERTRVAHARVKPSKKFKKTALHSCNQFTV
eukprot:364480-Chlamydomonas_euryale.AAC.19